MTRTYQDDSDIALPPRTRPGEAAVRSGAAWLVAVALAFTACQFLFVPPHLGLGFDESVYVSQVSGHAPASFFSAPRARGISYLVAPVASLTTSTVALRCYLALLSGAGLLGALWVWRRFQPDRVLALAGLVFGGLWITLFYGPQAMPNLWVALGSLACTGFFLRSVAASQDGRADRRALLGTALCLAAVVQLRPPDGFWLALPLVVSAVAVRSWRRPALLGAVVAGPAAGGAQWVTESFQRYGGVLARLHTSAQVEGGLSWNLAFGDQLRTLGGRTLCRPCTVPWQDKVDSLWWFAVPVLVVAGLYAARRSGRLASALVPTLCGLSMSVPYLLLVDYAAPRFLLPAYALLSLPAAECLAWIAAGTGRPRCRRIGTGLVVLGLAGHLAVQDIVLTSTVARNEQAHTDFSRVAADLNGLGVTPPCLITGVNAIPIGFAAGCASGATGGNNANMTAQEITATARRHRVAVLVPEDRPVPSYARRWTSHPLSNVRQLGSYSVLVAPGPTASPIGALRTQPSRRHSTRPRTVLDTGTGAAAPARGAVPHG
jgi:hypothetical protein